MTRLTPERIVYGLAFASDPQISPDGGRVAFVISRNAEDTPRQRSAVWLCDADGAGLRQITSGDAAASPRWSPDGARLAFTATRDGETGIWLLEDRLGEARLLTAHRTGIGGLAWSPDGARLAYAAAFD
ncbi:MAG: TolB family protein, partial [Chloroflexota bacterium]